MERELMLTGIGGQGVQLAAQTLARAATYEDRYVMSLGTYGGTMRGGNTDATLVFADGPVSAPPIVSHTWSAVMMHHLFWEPLRVKLRPNALLVVNTSVFETELDRSAYRVHDVPATDIATGLGNALGGTLVLVAAYAKLTGLVGIDSLCRALEESMPSYRHQFLQSNLAMLTAGYDVFDEISVPAWRAERVGHE